MTTKASRDVLDLSIRPVTKIVINNTNDPVGPRTIDATGIGISTPDVGFFTNLQASNFVVTNTADFTGAQVIGLDSIDKIVTVALNADYTPLATDFGKSFYCTGSLTLSFSSVAVLGAGWKCYVKNAGTGVVILDPFGSELIDGALSISLAANQSVTIVCTGTEFYTLFSGGGSGGGSGGDVSGTVKAYAGLTLPAGYLWCDGSAISRSTYSTLFGNVTISQTGNFTSGSAVVSNIPSTAGMVAGMAVAGPGVTSALIAAVNSSTQITLTVTATATAVGAAFLVAPYGVGDGSTTFNIPDYRGSVLVGLDNMGGTPAGRVTVAGSGVPGTLIGGRGGSETVTLTVATMPLHGHPFVASYTNQNSAHVTSTGGIVTYTANYTAVPYTGAPNSAQGHQIGGSGGGLPHQNMQPSVMVNYIIKY